MTRSRLLFLAALCLLPTADLPGISAAEQGSPPAHPLPAKGAEQPREEYLLGQIRGLIEEARALHGQGRMEEAQQHWDKAAYRAGQLAEYLSKPMPQPQPADSLITNGSFETRKEGDPQRNIETLQPGSDHLKGWEVIDPQPAPGGNDQKPPIVDWIGPERWKASHGLHCLDIDGGIRQSVATNANTVYALQFDMAGNPEIDASIRQLLHVWVDGDTHDFAFDPSGASRTDLKWATRHVLFRGKEPRTSVSFVNAQPNVYSAGVALDNVVLRPVPPAVADQALELSLRATRFEKEAAGLYRDGRTEEAKQHADAANRYRSQLHELLQAQRMHPQ
jgi:hypothetical protein